MSVITLRDRKYITKIRKEEHGCSIFHPLAYIEGNETIFEIFKCLDERGVEGGLKALHEMYPDYVSEIDNDIKQLCNELIEKIYLRNFAVKFWKQSEERENDFTKSMLY